MIYKTIDTASELAQEFKACNRDYYTYEAYEALLEMLEGAGEDFELDVVAICCDYTESDAKTIAQDYNIDISDVDEDEVLDFVLDYLNDETYAIATVDDKILYQAF